MRWIQRPLKLPSFSEGAHPVTRHILEAIPEIREFKTGLLNIFLQHTSASIGINENADPDVPRDLNMSLKKIAPETFPYRHTTEGKDDMPAHLKSLIVGASITVPVGGGRLLLGTWQGIYLFEHRVLPHSRSVVLTLYGEE